MTRDKLVDFIVQKIKEESEDYSAYAQMAADESYKNISEQMKQISEDEKKHHDCLIKMLATVAKEGGKDV